jgi:hypothetical protein
MRIGALVNLTGTVILEDVSNLTKLTGHPVPSPNRGLGVLRSLTPTPIPQKIRPLTTFFSGGGGGSQLTKSSETAGPVKYTSARMGC